VNLHAIVWKELWQRPTAMLASLLAILLGVAALVAIRHVTVFSQREVGRQLDALGANILILPKGASLSDYYAADHNGLTLPEEHVGEIMLAGLPGVEKVSPRLSVPVEISGKAATLTGVLPQQEFQARAAWQTATLFNKRKHVGCKKACETKPQQTTPDSLITHRTIEKLATDEAVVGAELAAVHSISPGDSLTLLGEKFRVAAVLPAGGTVDDGRVFAHLHTVQRLSKAGEVVSAIEVLGCCEDAAGQLVPQLASLLPDSRVVTISHVVETQVGVNRLMAGVCLLVLVVLGLVGGGTVLSTISANVRERRREIGTVMALGATPGMVTRLFLLKATWIGIAGGMLGAAIGTLLDVCLGPHWAGVKVSPLPGLCVIVCGGAWLLTVAAAWWPSRQAARLDPCICFQEI
jgi:putative ABC transport system permease protein